MSPKRTHESELLGPGRLHRHNSVAKVCRQEPPSAAIRRPRDCAGTSRLFGQQIVLLATTDVLMSSQAPEISGGLLNIPGRTTLRLR
jgi:hypothetical protein